MGEEIKKFTLGDLIEIKHGYAFKGEYFADDGSHVVLTPGNFYEEGGFKKKDQEKWYTGDIPEDYILNENDLIVAMTEQAEGLLGSSALVPNENLYLHNQRLGLVDIIDLSLLDKKYLYYLFNTHIIRDQIKATASGTKVRHTSPSRIYEAEVEIPSLETQQKIASILSAFDDLIENNTRRIAILEEMARLIYREWFVHYRYPGHEKDELVDSGTELGEVPEGWGVKSFSDIADFQNGKAFKPKHWQDEGLPIVKIRELKNGFTDNTAYYHGDDIDEKYYIDDGDLLFAWSASLGIFLWYKGQALLNQHIFNVSQKVSYLTKDYLYYALDVSLKEFLTKTAGTTMQHIRKSALDEVHIALPPEAVYKHFDNSISPINSQILTLHKNVQRLKETRDLLLPMLISGKVNVNK